MALANRLVEVLVAEAPEAGIDDSDGVEPPGALLYSVRDPANDRLGTGELVRPSIAPEWDIIREPEPFETPTGFIFPDFALQHRRDPGRRFILEIVGFWTESYLRDKLRGLRAAGITNLIICLDADRRCSRAELPEHAAVVPFRRRIDPATVMEILEPPRQTSGR